jgi:N-acetylmuramoyl-L-alanine amidase
VCEACVTSDRGVGRRPFLAGLFAMPIALFGRARRPTRPTVADVAVAPGLVIRPRAAWAGDGYLPKGPLTSEDVKFLLVHHTATGNTYTADGVIDIIHGVYNSQTTEKGWPDTCYNFLIDRFGTVWEGRTGSIAGPVTADATGGSQGFAQLVCLIGDFTSVLPSAEQVASLRLTLAWLADRDKIDTAPLARVTFVSRGSNKWPAGVTIITPTIVGHREMTATACPGDAFYPVVRDSIPAEVHALRVPKQPLTLPVGPLPLARPSLRPQDPSKLPEVR